MQSFSDALILLADRIHVLGDRPPVQALLIRDGRIQVAGTREACEAAAPSGARAVRVHGGTGTPGLTDAHVHLTLWALGRRDVSLDDAPDVQSAARRVALQAKGVDSEWVRGRGWDANRWGRFPRRDDLDRYLPDRPVCLESHDAHAVWLNSAALARCGIDAETVDPPGGRVVRDPETGAPTGVLLENAKLLATEHLPSPSADRISDALEEAQSDLHRLGITGVHSVEPTGLTDFSRLERAGRLRLRVLQHLPLQHLEAAESLGLSSGWVSPGDPFGRAWIRIGGIKLFLDGALGSRTAWMRQPYEGTEADFGISTLDPELFRTVLARMRELGFAAAVHAIGDAAVELAVIELGRSPPPRALPHRIEHLQLCPSDLLERVAASGIVASMQPVHLRSDIPAAQRHWGRRARFAFAFEPLLGAGAVLAFGSDVPVETPDPRQGLFAAVRRLGWDSDEGDEWYPENRITADEALRAYTEGPAFAAGRLDAAGRLLPGYEADLVVWDRDPLACAPDELLEMRPMLVMVGGEVVLDEQGGSW